MDQCSDGAPGPERPQCKMKSYLMQRFFNDPVDAMDKRLESAENNLNNMPMDPFTEVKKEEVDPEEQEVKREEEHPLDYSEVQVVSCGGPLEGVMQGLRELQGMQEMRSPASPEPLAWSPPAQPCPSVQRVTIQTSSTSGSPPPAPVCWRVSPVPWSALLAPPDYEAGPPSPPPSPKGMR